MEQGISTKDILGLQSEECEECNGTGTRLSLDLDSELLPCEWCHGSGKAAPLMTDSKNS
ncbi:MAG: hypothetical protein HQL69_03805 [Magnetococcales bacterium]|nr:hypothetical protein [Magnetococcales bacterium]